MKGYITVIIQTHTWLRKSFFVMLKTHTWKQLCVRNIIFIMFDGIKLSAPKPVTMVKNNTKLICLCRAVSSTAQPHSIYIPLHPRKSPRSGHCCWWSVPDVDVELCTVVSLALQKAGAAEAVCRRLALWEAAPRISSWTRPCPNTHPHPSSLGKLLCSDSQWVFQVLSHLVNCCCHYILHTVTMQ